MSRGLGRIGRAIAHKIECARLLDPITGKPGMVPISSWELMCDVYWNPDTGYDFTPAQRKAVTRAMHGFVRRHRQFALAGGHGRTWLYLYKPDDPLSAMWMGLKLPSEPSEQQADKPLADGVTAPAEAEMFLVPLPDRLFLGVAREITLEFLRAGLLQQRHLIRLRQPFEHALAAGL
jgi:hypothetical protein